MCDVTGELNSHMQCVEYGVDFHFHQTSANFKKAEISMIYQKISNIIRRTVTPMLFLHMSVFNYIFLNFVENMKTKIIVNLLALFKISIRLMQFNIVPKYIKKERNKHRMMHSNNGIIRHIYLHFYELYQNYSQIIFSI